MKKFKSNFLKILALVVVAGLILINLQFDVNGISTNEAFAGTLYDNMELEDTECWVSGEMFLMCVHGSHICDASDQGTCSEMEEN